MGAPGILQQLIDGVPQRTHIVVGGVCTQPDTMVPATAVMKELSFDFVFAYRPREFAEALALIARGTVDTAAFLTGAVDLDGVAGAFDQLRQPGDQVKVIVRPSQPTS